MTRPIDDREPAVLHWASERMRQLPEFEAETRRADSAETELRETSAELVGVQARLAEARGLLARIVKYAREDRADTPGVTRLARALAQAETLLSTPTPPPAPEPLRAAEVAVLSLCADVASNFGRPRDAEREIAFMRAVNDLLKARSYPPPTRSAEPTLLERIERELRAGIEADDPGLLEDRVDQVMAILRSARGAR